MARSWPSCDGQGSLGLKTETKASSRHGFPAQRPALSKSAASPLLFPLIGRNVTPFETRESRRNRRAPGASAGGKTGSDERLRSEQSGFSAAVGDRQIARLFRRQSTALPPLLSLRLSVSICVICGHLLEVGVAFVSSCLRVCDVGERWLCVSAPPRLCVDCSVCELCVSVPLWFSWC